MKEPTFLRTVFPLSAYSVIEQEAIVSRFMRVPFARQDFLLQEGKTAQAYWFLESGFARSYVTDPSGNDISTSFFTPGNIVIDWPSFFMRVPTRENIQALSDCVCWQLGYADFQDLFHSIVPFREQGRGNLVQSYFALKNRSISMIADQAKERYRRLLKEKPEIVQNVSLKQIATYLGITDTSLSRIRREIAEET